MSQYTIEAGTAQHLGDQLKQHDCVAIFAAPKAPGYMMAVLADGAGFGATGASTGEQVVRTAKQNFDGFSPLTETVEELLQTISKEAHTLLHLNALATRKEPYSTMVMLVITPEKQAIWAHLGDSRLYRFVGQAFQERTNDDAHIEKAIEAIRSAGRKGPQAVVEMLGNDRHTSFLSIGRHDELKAEDAFLLCSDGLWAYCSDEEMATAVALNSPRRAAEILIQLARTRGAGKDAGNCSMAIVRLLPVVAKSRSHASRPLNSMI